MRHQSHLEILSLPQRRALVVLVLLVVQLVLWTIPVCAGFLDEAQDTLAELARRALSVKEAILKTRQREDRILDLLTEQESELEQKKAELRSLVEAASRLESEIASLERALAQSNSDALELASSLEDTRVSMQMQLRYLQKHGRSADLLSFLVSESLAESELTGRALEQLLRSTERLASDYSTLLDRLNERRSELMIAIKDLDVKREELVRLRENHRIVLSDLDRGIQDTRAALQQARSEIADYEETLRTLEEDSVEIKMIIEREEREAAERERRARESWIGSFVWPVSDRYAENRVAAVGSDKRSAGIDIETGSRAEVVASRSGQVSHSGWVDGYGSTVVINHGSGYSTIYANCHNLRVAAGDFVLAGDVIAEMGPATDETLPCLHFEIRKDGLPVDPAEYLR